MTNMSLDETDSLINNMLKLIFTNYIDELSGFYFFIQDFDKSHATLISRKNDKIPSEIICILKILGLSNIKTYLDLYDAIINPITRDKLSDDNCLELLFHGISDDDIIKANEINAYTYIGKSALIKDLMIRVSGKHAETNNHVIASIAGIDGTRMPGWLIKPTLLLDYINKIDDFYRNQSLISNNAYEWFIANMNTSMVMLEEGTWDANVIMMLINDAFANINIDDDDYYYFSSRTISRILLTAYDKNDTKLYANALLTALFLRIVFIELNKPEYSDNYVDNIKSLFTNYDNLRTILLFICNQLAPNIDKPIEFIRELVKVNIQNMIK